MVTTIAGMVLTREIVLAHRGEEAIYVLVPLVVIVALIALARRRGDDDEEEE